MKRITLCLALVITLVAGLAFSATRGTPDQAKANVEEALAFITAKGQDAGLAEFSKADGKFVKGDLYIFAIGMDGMTLAHGANQKLIGKSLLDVKDSQGKLFMREMIDVAKTKGKGWVDYTWTNPESKKIEPKASYIVKFKEMLIGCGAYK